MAEGLFNENFDFDSYVALEELSAEVTEAPEAPDRAAASAVTGEVSKEFFDFARHAALAELFEGATEAHVAAAEPAVAYPSMSGFTPSTEQKEKNVRKTKSRGEIRETENGLEYREDADEDWELAVFHHDIWSELLAQADAHAVSMGGFRHEPAKGSEDWNRTAFCQDQKDWGAARSARPEVCFVIEKDREPDGHKPSPWLHCGRRVIDRKNHGMRFFSDVPVTISSAVEGFRLDAMQKLNPNVTWVDILGRTPRQFVDRRGATRGELGVTALSNKTMRFRRSAGILSWDSTNLDCNIVSKAVFLKIMGQSCIDANNTTSFGRDLTREEVKTLKQANETHKAQIKEAQDNSQASAALQQDQGAKPVTGPPHPPSSTAMAEPSSLSRGLQDTSHDTGEKRPHGAVSICRGIDPAQSSPKKARK